MTVSLVGRKCGMTRIFTADGASVPVTAIEVSPNVITQIKSLDSDGYCALQVTAGSKKLSRVSRAGAGHFTKAGVEAGKGLWELRVDAVDGFVVGQQLTVSSFNVGEKVDVVGQSKGKGFQGGIKRWNFGMQDATHGNSLSHRVLGSIGQCQTPGRVWKGKKMAGHLGDERVTMQSLEIVRIDESSNVILIKGSVPGATGGNVILRSAAKVKV
jgi:large subunit ribosomal protein L3